MKKVLIDTNVVLDKLAVRQPFHIEANTIFDLIADGKIIGFITASSITDIYFLLGKAIGFNLSLKAIENLLDVFEVISVTKIDCQNAVKSNIKDFEDALVAVCADKEDLDFIITRDDEFLKLPKAISPSDFLEKIK